MPVGGVVGSFFINRKHQDNHKSPGGSEAKTEMGDF